MTDREEFARMLNEIAGTRMPFGKYGPERVPPEGVPIDELPLEYLQWFLDRGGLPKGRLGELMRLVYEAKVAGMDEVFQLGRAKRGGRMRKPRPPRMRDFGGA